MSSTTQSPNWREILSAQSSITGKQEYLQSTNHRLDVNATIDGSLVTEAFDYIAATYPDAVTEVYTYKIGGAGGITVATVTVVYTDSTKDNISTVTKS